MGDVFISYSREDRPRVEKLASALEAEGFDVWWDKNLTGGSRFSKETEQRLRDARAVVVAWSNTSIESMWVADEATIARDSATLVPIAIDNVEPPIGFRQVHTISFGAWRGDVSGAKFDSLISALRERVSGEAAPGAALTLPRGASFDGLRTCALFPVLAACLVLAIVLGGVFIRQQTKSVGGGASPSYDGGSKDVLASIAVLPFSDLSVAGDQQYFSDGLAEELLNALTRVEGLHVASRTSSFAFRGQEAIGIPVIAKSLNVRHVLEGSVRKSGDTIRVTAQLIDGDTDQHLWSQTFDRTLSVQNLFDIQDEIARSIVDALGAELEGFGGAPARAARIVGDTQDLDAYELYLQANARFIRRGPPEFYRDTILMFEQATEIDSGFARAWAGLAAAASIANNRGVTDRDYFTIARAAAERAIELNPDVSIAYAALGQVAMGGERPEFEAALENFNSAIARDPRDATAFHWRGRVWRTLGFLDQSEVDAQRCLEIDPTYENCRASLEEIAFLRGDPVKAMEIRLRTMQSGANFRLPDYHFQLARTGRHLALVTEIQSAVYNEGGEAWMISPIYRAMIEPGFDHAGEYAQFKARMNASDVSIEFLGTLDLMIKFAFRAYDEITVKNGHFYWATSVPEFNGSAHQKRLIRDSGVFAYWRRHGFPPQCRPYGDDDFQCG